MLSTNLEDIWNKLFGTTNQKPGIYRGRNLKGITFLELILVNWIMLPVYIYKIEKSLWDSNPLITEKTMAIKEGIIENEILII